MSVRTTPATRIGLNWVGRSRGQRLLQTKGTGRVTYDHVGATGTAPPEGWTSEAHSAELGSGLELYEHAIHALKTWTQFDLSWVCPLDNTVPLQKGQVFGFQSRQLGVWLPHFCRIVYTFDEERADGRAFGFAYGTLTTHMLKGEERFEVTWNRDSDLVRFTISRFSQPANFLARLAWPVTQAYQRRFLRDAVARFSDVVPS